MKGKKVVFLNYIPSPYRVDFFNELSKKIDLNVIFYNKSMDNSPWKKEEKKREFNHTFLFEQSKLKGIFKLFKLLRSHRNDILVVGGYYLLPEIFTIFYCIFFRKEFILSSDGGFVTKGFFKTSFKKFLIGSANYWLSSGKNTTETLKYYGAKEKDIYEYHFTSIFNNELVNNIPDKETLYKERESLGLNPDVFYLTFVGQLVHRKGVDVLIEALKHDTKKNFETLIIGSGEQEDELKKMVLDSDLDHNKIHFLGKLTKNEILKYLKVSDAFVCPSREDIWGLVLNEAIANGLPLISTKNVGAAYSLIEEGENGYIVDVDNPEQLIEKINLLFGEKLNLMKMNSINKAKKYTIEQMVDDHLVLFNKLC